MTFEFLWTDYCFLILLVLAMGLVLNSLRKAPIRNSFAHILQRPMAVSAGIVLIGFVALGVLDSIHFKSADATSENATSLLDKLFDPLPNSYEKTYSAPLALNLFVTEIEIENGMPQQIHPRLKYPPPFLSNEAEKKQHIHQVLVQSFWYTTFGVLSFNLLMFLVCFYFLRQKIWNFKASMLSVFLTLWVLSFAFILSYWLSRDFHVLGTGQIGEDVFYYSIKSIRTGLVIGVLTTLFMMPLALFLGISAGYFGGWVDDLVQYLYTTLSSIPGVLLITASVLSLQIYIANHPQQFTTLAQAADARLLALCLILGITSWTNLCRLLRAETLKLREVDFVLAARAMGSSGFTIIRKHLLPNVMHIVVITLVLDFSFLVMAEAVLSYVGVGVAPMTISWGNMINGARLELARDPLVWWPIFAAFILMFVLVLAINLFADAVRDAFDPHHAGSGAAF